MATTLRARQIGEQTSRLTYAMRSLTGLASVEKLLNLNQEPRREHEDHHEAASTNGLIPQAAPILNADGEPIWKVLVFDNLGRDVISSVLKVNDLRSWGVTIHLYVG